MIPLEIMEQSTLDGVTLALSPPGSISATGGQAAVDRWFPVIRENKPGILAALAASKPAKESTGDTARGWLVRYPDGGVIETYIILADGTYPTRAEVLRDYLGSTVADPIAEPLSGHEGRNNAQTDPQAGSFRQ